MSTRHETVYWHGCRDEDCDMDSYGCVRVEVWLESPIDRGPIGYIYHEAIHCPQCALARFDQAVLAAARHFLDRGEDGGVVDGMRDIVRAARFSQVQFEFEIDLDQARQTALLWRDADRGGNADTTEQDQIAHGAAG